MPLRRWARSENGDHGARFGLAEALAGHGPFDEAIGAYRAAQNLFLALGP